VQGGQHLDALGAELEHGAGLDGHKRHEGRLDARQPGEVGPGHIVENVLAERVDGTGERVDLHGPTAPGRDGVEHQRQGGNVVEMGVGEQDVVYAQHLVRAQVTDAATGADEHIGVDQ
jgi:hypothetical protein